MNICSTDSYHRDITQRVHDCHSKPYAEQVKCLFNAIVGIGMTSSLTDSYHRILTQRARNNNAKSYVHQENCSFNTFCDIDKSDEKSAVVCSFLLMLLLKKTSLVSQHRYFLCISATYKNYELTPPFLRFHHRQIRSLGRSIDRIYMSFSLRIRTPLNLFT